MRLDAPIARRTFLGWGGMSAAMIALSRLRLVAPVGAIENRALRAVDTGDARILGALAERMVFTGDPEMPRFADTDALSTIDVALLQVPDEIRTQLHWGLRIFEYGPPVFTTRFSTFSGLDADGQDDYLRAWSESRFEAIRLAFQAFKNLSYLGYYSQDATWKGIHYDGPWAPKPRRQVEA